MRVARLLALSAIAKVYSVRRKAERYFSMKLAICLRRYRSNCCACCRSVKCARWAVTAILISMCGLFLPLTVIRQSDGAREFREDLYYRLNVVSLKIPALAERTEDIPLLANHLLRQAAERHKPFVRAFSTDAMKRLMTASWPGNVRQLVNVIEQCVALTSSPVISDALVEQALEGENTALPTFVEARNQFELNYLRKLLQITKGNVTHAARMAGRNRTEFYKLLSRHELDANDFKE